MEKEDIHDNTNARYLSDEQKNVRLANKQKTIKKQCITIDRLQQRMKKLISNSAFKIEKELSSDITEILSSANLSVAHSLFLQQQLKAINCKKIPRELQEIGFIKLPTARTLFDYSHATKIEQGIDTTILADVAKQVASEELNRKQYHVLLADEMYISKNLVVQKSTGEVIGFTNLDNLDKEVKILDTYLDDPEKEAEEEMASKILALMVRGLSSRVKDVVASFPVSNPSPKQMYIWTWQVIGALEKSGVRVIAFTCDGAPTNRAFIKLHKPVTVLPSGVIFDTVKKFAPDGVLLSKKGTRRLKKNGEPIKSYKLNIQAVFPDSYSRMKVNLAAVVISNTNDISSQQWLKTTELVEFLRKTNNWFDLLNGASFSHGVVTNNRRLAPYSKSDVEDYNNNVSTSRFQELHDYLNYLNAWKEEVQSKQQRESIATFSFYRNSIKKS
ncbi:Membrane protein insertase YidC [Frankliniella fusca]|uniref:Membrane protein insertase YidC n=1 Tax=Frankliniella fusca TaxID=407009 RepID=A0AAE1L9I7_9NEOP|nr:Membrane protein insertase YidC [Frankliniella fusca]